RQLLTPIGRMIDAFSSMTADLTLLLAALSIMTGVFVITGIPTKVGVLMLEAAGINLIAMAVIAFLFGALVGTGLPPAPTYILTALVIAPPMIKAGVDPWVVHFYAFFLAVWGELTPPTSVVAAVTAKIADASFMRTLGRALMLCVSLFTLMAGVFIRPELVMQPGVDQLAALGLILVPTLGIVFALQARFATDRMKNLTARGVLMAVSLFALLYPDDAIAAIACVPVVLIIAAWVLYQRPRQIRAAKASG
ncbi:MAG: TRAP transporter large permease subunit, partial [Alphaproteobacteria bacterium]